MMRNNTDFKVGESVWVKQGLCKPIQGKVKAIDTEHVFTLWIDTVDGPEVYIASDVYKLDEVEALVGHLLSEAVSLTNFARELEKYV